MDILQAAKQLTGASWNLRAGVLEQAEDGTPRIEAPSLEDLNALMADEAYKDMRASEYPGIPDQLDALWKIVNGVPDEQAEQMKGMVQAVKAKYPKPE